MKARDVVFPEQAQRHKPKLNLTCTSEYVHESCVDTILLEKEGDMLEKLHKQDEQDS
jgi:hypothetical protein